MPPSGTSAWGSMLKLASGARVLGRRAWRRLDRAATAAGGPAIGASPPQAGCCGLLEFTLPHEGHVVSSFPAVTRQELSTDGGMVESGSHPICGLLEAAAAGGRAEARNCALDIAAAGQLWLYADGAFGDLRPWPGRHRRGRPGREPIDGGAFEGEVPTQLPRPRCTRRSRARASARSFEPLMEDASSTHRRYSRRRRFSCCRYGSA